MQRARALQRAGQRLTGVFGGPEQDRVPAPQRPSLAALFAEADVVILGAHQAGRTARDALEAGLHVSVALPVAPARGVLRLAHLARTQGRVIHLFEPRLLLPGMRTLRGRLRGQVGHGFRLQAAAPGPARDPRHPGPSDPEALLAQHHPALAALVVLAGPVRALLAVASGPGRLDATLETAAGAQVQLALTDGADHYDLGLCAEDPHPGPSGPAPWRLEGPHLYRGEVMATLTDSRSPAELAMLELRRLLDPEPVDGVPPSRPTLPVEALHHGLIVGEALASGRPGVLG